MIEFFAFSTWVHKLQRSVGSTVTLHLVCAFYYYWNRPILFVVHANAAANTGAPPADNYKSVLPERRSHRLVDKPSGHFIKVPLGGPRLRRATLRAFYKLYVWTWECPRLPLSAQTMFHPNPKNRGACKTLPTTLRFVRRGFIAGTVGDEKLSVERVNFLTLQYSLLFVAFSGFKG